MYPCDRLSVVQVEDEVPVGSRPDSRRLAELRLLPELALVLSEVLHHEWPDVGDAEQTLPCGVDREAAEIGSNPATAKLLRDDGRRP